MSSVSKKSTKAAAPKKKTAQIKENATAKDNYRADNEKAVELPDLGGEITDELQKTLNTFEVCPFIYSSDDKVYFSNSGTVNWLMQQGFRMAVINNEKVFIHIVNNVVKVVEAHDIKQYIIYFTKSEYFECLEDVMKYLKQGYQGIFEALPIVKQQPRKKNRDVSHLFYKNIIVRIKASGYELVPYEDFNGLILESEIIERDFIPLEKAGHFEQFLINAIGEKDLLAARCCFGYLLHEYKNRTSVYAAILQDAILSLDNEANGGSGKGVYTLAVLQILKGFRIEGKKFSAENLKFALSSYKHGDKIAYLPDAKANLDVSLFNSQLTEGFNIERKGQNSFDLSQAESPKLIIDTNYPLKGAGGTFRRRAWNIYFSNYYNDTHQPIDDFKEEFFTEWPEGSKQWQMFDTFSVLCIVDYIKHGKVESSVDNKHLRDLIAGTSKTFCEFMYEDDEERYVNGGYFNTNDELIKFKQFASNNSMVMNVTAFGRYLKKFADINNYHLEKSRAMVNGERTTRFTITSKVAGEDIPDFTKESAPF